MWTQRLMWIAWPAFMVAGILEMLVFAMVDPQDLHWFPRFFRVLDHHHGCQCVDYPAVHVTF